MRPQWAMVYVAIACTGADDREGLLFEGATRVRVESLGPVEPPQVTLLDGSPADGILWVSHNGGIADVRDNRIVALAPGEAEITGTWQHTSVSWTLVVDPLVSLRFVDPPGTLSVGQTRTLEVRAMIGEAPVAARDLVWSVKPEGVVQVDGAGGVVAQRPGTAWVVAASGAAEAVVEIVVEP